MFFLTVLNHGDVGANFEVEILTTTSSAIDIPIPVNCGLNAHCSDGVCECNENYEGDPYTVCHFQICDVFSCPSHSLCLTDSFNTPRCECEANYSLFNGNCHHDLCPRTETIVSQNILGFAMGTIQSPTYGTGHYPSNFDCTYTISAPKMDSGSSTYKTIYHQFFNELKF